MSQPVRTTKRADELVVGDRIARRFLVFGEPAQVIFVRPYRLKDDSERWMFVAYKDDSGFHDSTSLLALRPVPIEARPADPLGQFDSRVDDEGPAEDMTVTRFGRGDETAPGLIVGDTAEEQMGNAYAAYERDEAELRETVHWCTSDVIDLVIACGNQGGPFTKDFDKVTCRDCLATVGVENPVDGTPAVACHTCGGAARVVDGDLVHVGEHGQMVLPAHPHDAWVG